MGDNKIYSVELGIAGIPSPRTTSAGITINERVNLNDLRSEVFLLLPSTYAAAPTEEQMNAAALNNNEGN